MAWEIGLGIAAAGLGGAFINNIFGDDPPKPPDPAKLIEEQAEANRISIFTPRGDLRFGQLGEQGQFVPDLEGTASFIDLPPDAARALQLQQELARILSGKALNQANQLPGNPPSFKGLPAVPTSLDFSGLTGLPLNINPANFTPVPGTIDTSGFSNIPNTIDAGGFSPVPGGIDTGLFAPLPGDIDFSEFAKLPRGIDTGLFATVPQQLDFRGLIGLPGIDDFGEERSRVEQARFDRLTGLLSPVFDQREAEMRQRLANRGLPIGSEAFEGESDRFDRTVNEAMLNAANDAVLAGGQEQSRLFGMGLQARQQQVGEAMSDAAHRLGVRSQQLNEALADASQAMASRGISLQEGLAQANLGLAVRDTNLREALADAEAAFRARGLDLGEALAAAQTAFQSRGVDFSEALASAGQATVARGIDFQESTTMNALQLQRRQQQLAEQMQNIGLRGDARQRALSELLLRRAVPHNELASLTGLQQVQTPQFPAPNLIDILGPNAMQFGGQQSAFNANQQQNQAFQSGVFGLGNTLLLSQLLGGFGGGGGGLAASATPTLDMLLGPFGG